MTFNKDIFELARQNPYFRHVLYTTERSQVVLMSIPPKEEIGAETHHLDQLLIFVEGEARAVINNEPSQVHAQHLVVVPAGTQHNFINTGQKDLKLFTIYSPPEHAQGLIDKTKSDAENREKSERNL